MGLQSLGVVLDVQARGAGAMSRKPSTRHTKRQCEAALIRAMPSQAQAADGTRWTCTCGLVYVHVCDEAEGCGWEPTR